MRHLQVTTIILIMVALLFNSCEKESAKNGGEGDKNWQIPKDQVHDGGPGKDGIPSLENPDRINASEAGNLEPNDLVVGFKSGGEIVAYPHPIMDHHEIANDQVGNTHIAITYCPLTGTAIGWDRKINGEVTTFGVSGLLHNNNLIPYDRLTDSNWSQMLMESISGEKAGTEVKTHMVVETTWKSWQNMYPNTEVISRNTGHSRDYDRYPYGNYKNTKELHFPVQNKDDRMHRKERVLGVIAAENAKVYKIAKFSDGVDVIQDQFNGQQLVIAGSKELNFAVAFERSLADSTHSFSPVQDDLPVIMEDNEGNRYNIFGEVVKGPEEGDRLSHANSYIGYWFAWAAFFPDVKIHQQ